MGRPAVGDGGGAAAAVVDGHCGVDAEQVIDRCTDVANMNWIVLDERCVLVGGAPDRAGFQARAGQQDGIAIGPVVAAALGIHLGRAAHLAHGHDERLVQETTRIQISQEGRVGLVEVRQQRLLEHREVTLVRVPRRLAHAEPLRVIIPTDVDEAYISLEKPAGQERRGAEKRVAVPLAQAGILVSGVKRGPEALGGEHVEGQALEPWVITQAALGKLMDEWPVRLIDQAAAIAQARERDFLGKAGSAQIRLAANSLRAPDVIGGVVDRCGAFGAKWVVAPAQESGVRAGFLAHFTPAERTGKIHVGRQCGGIALEVSAHRAHAGRIGVAEVFVQKVHIKAGVHRQVLVAASVVEDAADDRRPMHPAGRQGEQLADVDAGSIEAIGLNSLRMPSGAPGFRSNMSWVGGPPWR